MKFFTPLEIVDLIESSGIRVPHIYTMHDMKQIYALYRSGILEIPIDSFIRFLDYNPIYREAFYECNPGNDMRLFQNKEEVLNYMTGMQPICDEEYSISQLEKIFNVTKKTIKKEMKQDKHPFRYLFRKYISVSEILIYLKKHPNTLEKLNKRHDFLLATGPDGDLEVSVRHILMLYSYYEGYGYII